MKDDKSAAKFHYIKTASSKVVSQLPFEWYQYIGRDRPLPMKSWLNLTYALLMAATLDTFCLVAPQRQELAKKFNYDSNVYMPKWQQIGLLSTQINHF